MRAAREAVGQPPHPEIMIPLVAYEHELEIAARPGRRGRRASTGCGRGGLHRRHDDRAAARLLHRRPDRAPRRLLLVRHQRPHPDRARLLARRRRVEFVPTYLDGEIIDRSPFETIDSPASAGWCGWRRGVGREAQPASSSAICGEHGGDPDSIAFFHRAGLDYVSLLAVPAADRPDRGGPGGDRGRYPR